MGPRTRRGGGRVGGCGVRPPQEVGSELRGRKGSWEEVPGFWGLRTLPWGHCPPEPGLEGGLDDTGPGLGAVAPMLDSSVAGRAFSVSFESDLGTPAPSLGTALWPSRCPCPGHSSVPATRQPHPESSGCPSGATRGALARLRPLVARHGVLVCCAATGQGVLLGAEQWAGLAAFHPLSLGAGCPAPPLLGIELPHMWWAALRPCPGLWASVPKGNCPGTWTLCPHAQGCPSCPAQWLHCRHGASSRAVTACFLAVSCCPVATQCRGPVWLWTRTPSGCALGTSWVLGAARWLVTRGTWRWPGARPVVRRGRSAAGLSSTDGGRPSPGSTRPRSASPSTSCTREGSSTGT